MTGAEGPLRVCGSQASDSKEALCGRQPAILLQVVFLVLLLSKKIKNTKIF